MHEQEDHSWTLVLKLPWKLEELTLYLKRLHTRINLVLGFSTLYMRVFLSH